MLKIEPGNKIENRSINAQDRARKQNFNVNQGS